MRHPRHGASRSALIAVLLIATCITATAEPRARFTRVVAPQGRLAVPVPGESPWSPNGDLLALIEVDDRATSLLILDATMPLAAPRRLVSMPGPMRLPIVWSPDGKWIACQSKLRTQEFLWIIRVEDGARHLAGVGDAWPFIWGSNRILLGFRHSDGEEIIRFDVSSLMDEQPSDSLDHRSRLAFIGHRSTTEMEPVRLELGAIHKTTPIAALGRSLLLGTFPDRQRFLVKPMGGKGLVVNADGTVLSDVGDRISPRSATADGRYVAGFHEVDDGHTITSAEVLLFDLAQHEEIPVDGAPQSTEVECSPVGPMLALETLHEGLVIGRLHIDRRRSAADSVNVTRRR